MFENERRYNFKRRIRIIAQFSDLHIAHHIITHVFVSLGSNWALTFGDLI